MKIVKENYNEMLNLLADGLVSARYNRECFSSSDVQLEARAWNEISSALDALANAGVNFDKFVVPVMKTYGIELCEERLEEVRCSNTSDALPNDLNVEVECPLLESVEEWAHGGCRHNECLIKVVD